MPNLIAALPTSKSPRSESLRLSADVIQREQVTPSDREEMYQLLEAYFQNTSVQQFAHDLAEKDTVILLRDPEDARVVGFSTLMKIEITIENRNVVGFFSGDTIIAREHWGSSLLARLWVTTVFREADRIRQHSPDTLFYWFLISAGYKTWRYLPTFFVAYAPHPDLPPSPFDRQVMRTLAAKKFGDDYQPDAGIVRFRRANPLRPGVAEVTERRLRDPLVEFFIRMNPGHAQGDELACLVPISHSNLTAAGLRMLKAGLQE
jgi:hypothetical protein